VAPNRTLAYTTGQSFFSALLENNGNFSAPVYAENFYDDGCSSLTGTVKMVQVKVALEGHLIDTSNHPVDLLRDVVHACL
jgi:hypothetical protein